MLDLHERTRVTPLNPRNLPGWLHQSGDLDVRLATSPGEIETAQALRYNIFDVFVLMPVERITARYAERFTAAA